MLLGAELSSTRGDLGLICVSTFWGRAQLSSARLWGLLMVYPIENESEWSTVSYERRRNVCRFLLYILSWNLLFTFRDQLKAHWVFSAMHGSICTCDWWYRYRWVICSPHMQSLTYLVLTSSNLSIWLSASAKYLQIFSSVCACERSNLIITSPHSSR